MKKIIVIFSIIIILAVVLLLGYKYYKMSPEEKYELKLSFMSEKSVRKEIENAFYFETNNEACDLNHSYNFGSKEDCENCIRCGAVEISNIIPKNDIKLLAKEMNRGEHAESATLLYFESHKELKDAYLEKLNYCPCRVNYLK